MVNGVKKCKVDELSSFINEQDSFMITNFITNNYKNSKTNEWIQINKNLKCILLNGFNYKENVFEFHQKYMDIHITIKGKDIIYIGDSDINSIIEEYNTVLDYSLVNTQKSEEYLVEEMECIIISPHIIHSNKFFQENTNKIVFKISKNE